MPIPITLRLIILLLHQGENVDTVLHLILGVIVFPRYVWAMLTVRLAFFSLLIHLGNLVIKHEHLDWLNVTGALVLAVFAA